MIIPSAYADSFDRLLDTIEIGFGLPSNIRFNTGKTKDMMPAFWKVWQDKVEYTTDEYDGDVPNAEMIDRGFKAVCRTVGIDEKDIKITEEDYGLCLQGETEVDGVKYSQYIELPISKDVMANVKSIGYKSKDGLTFIYLEVDTPKRNKLKIERLSD